MPKIPACILACTLALVAPGTGALAATTQDSIAYSTRVADINRVGLWLTNHGVIGNNFSSRSPSLEYPLGTGYEHLTLGGLWFGAHAVDATGVFTGVSTGAQDGNIGSGSAPRSEFTPAGTSIVLHSRSSSSPFYDPTAVSDMDYRWVFSDLPAKNTTGESHRPLNVLVRASVLSWNSPGLEDFLILRFTIINLGQPLTDAWAGLWTELASGPKNAYTSWPPSSSGSTIGGWFSKKWVQYDSGLRLVREHYCFALPVPGGCVLSRVPAWMGLKLLGTSPGPIGGKQVTLAAWNYSPGNALRDEDVERYAIMSAGTIQNLTQPDLMPQSGDPEELLAVGPFSSIASGDSVTVDFAVVGGAEVADIQANAAEAQLHYDHGFDVPTPAQMSLVSADAGPDQARLVWYGAGASTAVEIQKNTERGEWNTIAHAVADGEGYVTYVDLDVHPGTRYGYRVWSDGAPLGETWVDIPNASAFSLSGVHPNPTPGGLAISFSLPDAAPARLEVLDLAGRRLLAREVGPLGAGAHVLDLADGRRLAAGVYLVRLTRGGRGLTTRVVVIR